MNRRGWRVLARRLTGALLAPATDPRTALAAHDSFSSTLARIDATLASLDETRQLLAASLAAGEERLAAFDAERAGLAVASSDRARILALLDERRDQALRKQQFLRDALDEVRAETRRLLVLRDRLGMEAETLALRREIAAARRSAAEARYDAGESILGLSDESGEVSELLETAERQAREAAARADAVEQLLATWARLADW